MGDVALRVENLSKQYQIAAVQRRYDTLRDQLMDGLKLVLRRTGQPQAGADTIWALKGVSFEIAQGEVVGIIGRNGAGKSTLLKILSRITKPTAGRAEIYGRMGSLLEVGTGFDRELSGRENIYLSGAILGMKKAEITKKFDEIVAFAEVEKFVDTPVKRYSSGMYLRLAFAVAAHLEPEILLVDEVLAVGDASFQKKCLGKMGEVSHTGRTILFVSHNMAMIQHLCTRAIFFNQGIVRADGSPRQVIDTYLAETVTLSKTGLEERTDRSGAGGIIITAIEALDNKGKPCPNPVTGQELILRMHYQCRLPKVFLNCRVSLSVHKDEHVYFLLSTELVSRQQLNLKGIGYLDFVIPDLPLSAGEYYLNSFIESNKIIEDWVIGAAMLSIVDGDYFGTGRNYPEGWQGRCVLVKHHWALGEEDG